MQNLFAGETFMEAFWFLSCSLSSVNQSHLSRLKMPASKQHGEEKSEGICLNPISKSSDFH